MALYARTLGGMKARIASEIARPDLTTQIENAINDAILIYQKERFRFNETDPLVPITFPTVIGQAYYQASIPSMYYIDYLNFQDGTSVFKIDRVTPEEIRMRNQGNGVSNGQPESFAIEGNKIMLAPTPSNVWTVTQAGHFMVAAPAADDTANNVWMTDGERLIRCRAKYEIAVHVTRNPTMTALMSPHARAPGETYEAWKELKSEFNKLVGKGRVAPMQF